MMEDQPFDLPIFNNLELLDLLTADAQLDKALIASSLRLSAQQLLEIYGAAHTWAVDIQKHTDHFVKTGSAERTAALRSGATQFMLGMTCDETAQPLSSVVDRSVQYAGGVNLANGIPNGSVFALKLEIPQIIRSVQASLSDFAATNNLFSLDLAILQTSLALAAAGKNHPLSFSFERNCLVMYLKRYRMSNDPLDIDRMFWHLGRAVLSCPNGVGAASEAMFLLEAALRSGRDVFKNSLRFNLVISFKKQVFLLQTDNDRKAAILGSIARFYCAQLEKIGESIELNKLNILFDEQAAVLSAGGRTDNPEWIAHLAWHYRRQFRYLGNLTDASRAIEYLSQANSMTSDEHPFKSRILYYFCKILIDRFRHLGKISDLDEAITYQLHGLRLPSSVTEDRADCMLALGNAYSLRYERLKEMPDLDRAIQYRQENIHLAPDDPSAHSNLGLSYRRRYDQTTMLSDLDSAIDCQLRSISLPTFHNHSDKSAILQNAANAYGSRFKHLGDPKDLDKALEHQSQAVQVHPDGPATLQALHVSFLGSLHASRYMYQNTLEDINEAVRLHSQSVALTSPGHARRCGALNELGNSLSRRYKHLGLQDDLEKAQSSFQAGTLALESPPSSRFDAASDWATLCVDYMTSSDSLPAYGLAMSLLPQVAWVGAAISWRYNQISSKKEIVMKALEAAVKAEAYDLALEWLEQGRSIVWRQLLQLRTPLEELHDVNPRLATRIGEVSSILERPDFESHQASTDADPGAVSEEQISHRRRRVAEEWEGLIEQARQLPGFGNFMQPAKTDELVRSASSSTVVVLVVHQNGCIALVIKKGAQRVEHVTLPRFNLGKATLASNKIKKSFSGFPVRGSERKITSGSEGSRSQNQFPVVLTALWFDLVQPILAHLGYTDKYKVTELPRVTWCCTGPISFLPLHAAGDYTATGTGARAFHYAISSYTPTLTSLISSPKLAVPFTGILAISQSQTLGEAPLPGATEEIERIAQLAEGLPLTQIRDEEANADAVITGMAHHGWVHLACHASQDLTEPQNSAFQLHGGPLSLRRIAEQQIKVADFAFLSACQTVTGDESMPDEAVHLAAGMLMTGYKTVIATMWSIRDEDAPFVAEHVYRHLLEDGIPDSKRASVALHDAIAKLRERVGEESFAVWVPYIHLGQ